MNNTVKKPPWLSVRVNAADSEKRETIAATLRSLSLHTVCEEANCPNMVECFGKGTATFMILGSHCTRTCRFCAVDKSVPDSVNASEADDVVKAIAAFKLRYVVITSVTRDDIPDGGASHYVSVLKAIRAFDETIPVEVLIPDFGGNISSIIAVADVHPAVLNHNIETISRLYPAIRPQADYQRSLELLALVKRYSPALVTKSGIMVGLGETEAEVHETLRDIRSTGCDCVTIGQYLAPSVKHAPVVSYVTPEAFDAYRTFALSIGFSGVASGPLVRSSYKAHTVYSATTSPR
ncbi:MAG: lipoyl synthase [Spirochaetes bacterium]|nr:lipoyl synthase [Spirochaetota bacterium]